jgi:hypothetical protein
LAFIIWILTITFIFNQLNTNICWLFNTKIIKIWRGNSFTYIFLTIKASLLWGINYHLTTINLIFIRTSIIWRLAWLAYSIIYFKTVIKMNLLTKIIVRLVGTLINFHSSTKNIIYLTNIRSYIKAWKARKYHTIIIINFLTILISVYTLILIWNPAFLRWGTSTHLIISRNIYAFKI